MRERERERGLSYDSFCSRFHRYPTALRNLLRQVLHIKGFIRTKLEENDKVKKKDECERDEDLFQQFCLSLLSFRTHVSV